MKKFVDYIQEWESNAEKDAYWSVLTSSQFEMTPWDKPQFFQTGIQEIRSLREYIKKKEIPLSFEGKALDFGCGVGRLSSALAPFFEEVWGVDISRSMISEANLALSPSIKNVHYIQNPSPDLKIFKNNEFDFIYSNIVLQHIGRKNQLHYLSEMARVMKIGGWMVVQIPSEKIHTSLLGKIKGLLTGWIPHRLKKKILVDFLNHSSRALRDFDFEINVCPEHLVRKVGSRAGMEIIHIAYTNSCDPDFSGNLRFFHEEEAMRRPGFLSPIYFMRKIR